MTNIVNMAEINEVVHCGKASHCRCSLAYTGNTDMGSPLGGLFTNTKQCHCLQVHITKFDNFLYTTVYQLVLDLFELDASSAEGSRERHKQISSSSHSPLFLCIDPSPVLQSPPTTSIRNASQPVFIRSRSALRRSTSPVAP
jgi:hypothetical protein